MVEAPVSSAATDFIVGGFRRNYKWTLYPNSSYNLIDSASSFGEGNVYHARIP
jgi:hypothetical protein